MKSRRNANFIDNVEFAYYNMNSKSLNSEKKKGPMLKSILRKNNSEEGFLMRNKNMVIYSATVISCLILYLLIKLIEWEVLKILSKNIKI